MSYWREMRFNRLDVANYAFICAGVPMMWTASTRDLRALGTMLTFVGDVFLMISLWPNRFMFSLHPLCIGNPEGHFLVAGWSMRAGGRRRRTLLWFSDGRVGWRLRLWPSEDPHPIPDCQPIEETNHG